MPEGLPAAQTGYLSRIAYSYTSQGACIETRYRERAERRVAGLETDYTQFD